MAVQLNPSLAPAHAEFGFIKQALAGNTGGLNHALDGLAFARRISPSDPVLANWLYGVGVDFLKLGEDARAIRWLNESIGLNPLPPALAYLAAAYALSGDETRARHALGEFRRMPPRETLWGFKRHPSGLAGVRGTAKGWIAGTVELASHRLRPNKPRRASPASGEPDAPRDEMTATPSRPLNQRYDVENAADFPCRNQVRNSPVKLCTSGWSTPRDSRLHGRASATCDRQAL
jgi:hypothetical protein